MVFTITVIALIIAITFFLALHGLFSSFIMMVLTILSAALAFGWYEDAYFGFARQYMREYGEAVSLVALFVIFLTLLRVLFDKIVPGNMVIPINIDRIGAGICGFVTALFATGIIVVGFQLLPFEADILGFQRIEKTSRKNVILNPDGIAVKTVSYLSSNILSGRQEFASAHPDFLLELHGSRTIPKESVHRAPVNAINLTYLWDPGNVVYQRSTQTLKRLSSGGSSRWCAIRVRPLEGGDDGSSTHRFSAYSWRLVGKDEEGQPLERYAFALKRMGDSKEKGRFVKFDWDEFVSPQASSYPHFDLVFEIPDGFVPAYLEYKRTAREGISAVLFESNESPPEYKKTAPKTEPASSKKEPKDKEPPSQSKSDKKTGTITGTTAGTDPRRPFKITKDNEIPVFFARSVYNSQKARTTETVLQAGHVAADVPRNEKSKTGTIQTFAVPKGMTMIQVWMDPKSASSVFGKAMTFAKRNVMQWRISDQNGKDYWPLGEIRIAGTMVKKRIEIQYDPKPAIPERALKPPKSVDEDALLSSDSVVIFLFLVPEKAKITKFKAQKKEYSISL